MSQTQPKDLSEVILFPIKKQKSVPQSFMNENDKFCKCNFKGKSLIGYLLELMTVSCLTSLITTGLVLEFAPKKIMQIPSNGLSVGP